MQPKNALLKIDDKEYALPIMIGSEGERAIDMRNLRKDTGHICYDQGYGNTGSCESAITFLDGDTSILRHRGYPIEQLAEQSEFVETAYLVIYGELPTPAQRKKLGSMLRENAAIDTQMMRRLPPRSPADGHAHFDRELARRLLSATCYK